MRIVVLIMFYTMIYIKRSSEEGIDIRKNKKTQVITSNYDVSVKSISRTGMYS